MGRYNLGHGSNVFAILPSERSSTRVQVGHLHGNIIEIECVMFTPLFLLTTGFKTFLEKADGRPSNHS